MVPCKSPRLLSKKVLDTNAIITVTIICSHVSEGAGPIPSSPFWCNITAAIRCPRGLLGATACMGARAWGVCVCVAEASGFPTWLLRGYDLCYICIWRWSSVMPKKTLDRLCGGCAMYVPCYFEHVSPIPKANATESHKL